MSQETDVATADGRKAQAVKLHIEHSTTGLTPIEEEGKENSSPGGTKKTSTKPMLIIGDGNHDQSNFTSLAAR